MCVVSCNTFVRVSKKNKKNYYVGDVVDSVGKK